MERQEKEHTGLVEYLTIVKRMVETDGLDSFEKVHLVVGNEACDLDSAVSALVYAFHLWKVNERPQTSIVPILGIPQADFDIKTEVKFALTEQGIDQTTLVFADCRIDPVRLGTLGKLILTLVDHHVPVGKFTGCESAVIEVIDHHPVEESNRTKFLRNVKLTIEPVGSCATLIAEKLLSFSGPRTLSPVTALLLYETIVLDTSNFSLVGVAHKATPKDSRIAEQLTSLFNSRFTREEVFERLAAANADLSTLTVEQVLRKNAKLVEGTLGKLIICSIPVLCQSFFETDEKQKALQKFCLESDLKGVVILGVVLQGDFEKDILIFANEQPFLSEIVDQLCGNPDISLELYRDYNFQPSVQYCQHFRQGKTAVSRGQIVSVISSLLGSPLQSSKDSSNAWKFAELDVLREHPDEQQVPALSPLDFGIQTDRQSGRSTPVHRIRNGNSPLDFDDEDCGAVDEELLKADLSLEGKRSSSPVYAQIDHLKSEHQRMVIDSENGAAVLGGIRGSSTWSGFDQNAHATLHQSTGLDEVDGNPTSIMNSHEAGNDESRPIMTALPMGFGATKITRSPPVDVKSKTEKDSASLAGMKNDSIDEDIIIDHTAAPPALCNDPMTDAPNPTAQQETGATDPQSYTDNQEISLIVDGLKKSSKNSGPRSLPLKFFTNPTEYTYLRQGRSPSPKVAAEVSDPVSSFKDFATAGEALGHNTVSKNIPNHGDTLDGLEPATSSTSPSAPLEFTEKCLVTSERESFTPLEKLKLFDKEAAGLPVVENQASLENETAQENENESSLKTRLTETVSGATSCTADSAAEAKAAENMDVATENKSSSVPLLHIAEKAVLFQSRLLRSTQDENQGHPPLTTMEGSPEGLPAIAGPLKLPKTPDWETFESIANRRNQSAEKYSFDDRLEKREDSSIKSENLKIFTIVPDIPRSESVERQKNVSKNSVKNGLDEVDTGNGPFDIAQKSAEKSDKENVEKEESLKDQPARSASPTPDSVEWWKPTQRVDYSRVSESPKGETASMFMLEVEKEMEKRKAAELLDALEMAAVGDLQGRNSTEPIGSECGNNQYPWMGTANPGAPCKTLEVIRSSESENAAGISDRTSAAIEEKNVDGSLKSPIPFSCDADKVQRGPAKANDPPINTHSTLDKTEGNGDTLDGLPGMQPVHSTVGNTIGRKRALEESKSTNNNGGKKNFKDEGPIAHIPPETEDLEQQEKLIDSTTSESHTENQSIDRISSDADRSPSTDNEENGSTSASLNSGNEGALVWVKSFTKVALIPNIPLEIDVIADSLDNETGLSAIPTDEAATLVALPEIRKIIPQSFQEKFSEILPPSKGHDETDTGRPPLTRTEGTNPATECVGDFSKVPEERAVDSRIPREVAAVDQTRGLNVDREHLHDLAKNSEHIVSGQSTSLDGKSESPPAQNHIDETPPSGNNNGNDNGNDDDNNNGNDNDNGRLDCGIGKGEISCASSSQSKRLSTSPLQNEDRQQVPDHRDTKELTTAEKGLELFQFSRAQNQANENRLACSQGDKDQVDSGGRSSGSGRFEIKGDTHIEPKLKRQKISLVSRESSDTGSMMTTIGQEGEPAVKNSVSTMESTSFDGDCESNMSSPTDLTSTVNVADPSTNSAPSAGDEDSMKPKHANPSTKDQESVWAIDMTAIEAYKNVLEVHMDKGDISQGATVCFFACNLPSRSTPKYEYIMQNIFRYFMSTLDLLADHQCILVYFNGAVPAVIYPATSWLHQCYKMIDRRMQKNLQELIIVHPNFWFKAQLQTIGRAFLSGSFYNKIRYIDTLESLQSLLGMDDAEFRLLAIPTGIAEQEAKWNSKSLKESPTAGRRFALLRKCSF